MSLFQQPHFYKNPKPRPLEKFPRRDDIFPSLRVDILGCAIFRAKNTASCIHSTLSYHVYGDARACVKARGRTRWLIVEDAWKGTPVCAGKVQFRRGTSQRLREVEGTAKLLAVDQKLSGGEVDGVSVSCRCPMVTLIFSQRENDRQRGLRGISCSTLIVGLVERERERKRGRKGVFYLECQGGKNWIWVCWNGRL